MRVVITKYSPLQMLRDQRVVACLTHQAFMPDLNTVSPVLRYDIYDKQQMWRGLNGAGAVIRGAEFPAAQNV